MKYIIQPANIEDSEQLFKIENSIFALGRSQEQFKNEINNPDRHIILCAKDKNLCICGYVGMMYVLDEGYIDNVAVVENFRREGIGSLLIQSMIDISNSIGLSFITLEVRESNVPAIKLYEKFNFIKVGIRKNYYNYPKESAILMTLYLREAQSENNCI